jgi:protein-disulfide isomerase
VAVGPLVAALAAAVAIAAALVAVSVLGSRSADTEAAAPAAVAAPVDRDPLLRGIPQDGIVLGRPDAPVTLVEYADLQCPYCAQWARDALPTLIEDYVKPGRLRIVFNGLAFIGADSDKALRTAIAAGQQNHFWDVVHGLYANQGHENAGWVTDDLVVGIAAAVPRLDGDKLLETRWESSVEAAIKRAADAAQAAGVSATPTFQVGPTGGRLDLVRVDSLGPEGIVPAIEAVLAR